MSNLILGIAGKHCVYVNDERSELQIHIPVTAQEREKNKGDLARFYREKLAIAAEYLAESLREP